MSDCPCCGQTLPDDMPLGLRLRGNERRIYERVRKAGQHGITSERLFDWLYADDPNGGPASQRNVVQVTICNINKKLKMINQRIESEHWGGRGNFAEYKLLNLNA